MATRQVMIISPIAGDNFALKYGDLVDLESAVADEWVAIGLAQEAPKGVAASKAMAALQADLDAEKARSDKLAAEIDAIKAATAAAPSGDAS